MEGESYEIVTVETPYLGDLVIVSYLSNDYNVYIHIVVSLLILGKQTRFTVNYHLNQSNDTKIPDLEKPNVEI